MPSFTNNLLSMGKFCDAGCEVTFTATDVRVVNKTGTVILQGYREQTGAKMWQFNIHPDHPQAEAYNAATPNPHIIPPDIEPKGQQPPTPAAPQTTQQPVNKSPPHIIPPDIEPKSQQPQTTQQPAIMSPPQRSTEYHRRAYDLPSTKNLIEYLHCTAGSPVKSSFLQAVKAGNYRNASAFSAAFSAAAATLALPFWR